MFSQLFSKQDSRSITAEHFIHTPVVSHTRVPLVEASAKVYHAKFGAEPTEWQYFHQKGKVIFGKDEECGHGHDGSGSVSSGSGLSSLSMSNAEKYWFRLVDPLTGKVNWLFPVPENLVYQTDKPFFHVFNGRSRMWGFLFEDDVEGTAFGTMVKRHLPSAPGTQSTSPARNAVPKKPLPLPTLSRLRSRTAKNRPPLLTTQSERKISASSISLPRTSSFIHLGHIGVTRDGQVDISESVDPSWARILTERQMHANEGYRSTIARDSTPVGCFQAFI